MGGGGLPFLCAVDLGDLTVCLGESFCFNLVLLVFLPPSPALPTSRPQSLIRFSPYFFKLFVMNATFYI